MLVGLMGSGKSTVARLLGDRLGGDVADTDALLERSRGKTVREIFETDGEDAFRVAETAALEEALSSRAAVVAAAGGVVVREANRDILNRERAAGRIVVVWLKAPATTLARRAADGDHRPLLDEGADAVLARLESERAPFYADVSDAIVETEGVSAADVADAVLAVVAGTSR